MIHLRGFAMFASLTLLFVVVFLLIVGCSDPDRVAVHSPTPPEMAPPAPTPTAVVFEDAPPTTETLPLWMASVRSPTPKPRPAPSRRLNPRPPAGCYGWLALVASYFPANEIDNACRIIGCESKGDPNAVSPTSDHGIWQANKRTWDKPDHPEGWQQVTGTEWGMTHNPEVSTKWAAWLWGRSGWSPWVCARILGIV